MKRNIIICLFSTVLLTGLFTGCSSNEAGDINNTVIEKNESQYIMAGKIEANDEANITSTFSARISQIMVDLGSKVKVGDVLIKLDSRDLKAKVDVAQAGVNTAKAALANINTSVRPEQVSQASSALDNSNQGYSVAKKNYDRSKSLLDSGALSQQQLDAAQLQLVAAQSAQKSAQEQLKMLSSGPTPANIQVYKAQLSQAEASLEVAQIALSNAIIVSPISGIISAKTIKIGEMATTDKVLFSISNSNALSVNAYAPLDIADKLKEGQSVVIKASKIEGETFKGKISVINSKLNSRNLDVLVKVSILNPNGKLKSGMFVEIGLNK